jgi:hypothetical protein
MSMSVVGILGTITALLGIVVFLVWSVADRLREIRDELISFRRQFPEPKLDD